MQEKEEDRHRRMHYGAEKISEWCGVVSIHAARCCDAVGGERQDRPAGVDRRNSSIQFP